jgi:8-oxo-dGTP diphosphatase
MTSAGPDFARWRPKVIATLVYLIDGDRLLLIRKLRGHGMGKVNGPGGKVEPDETPLACAARECMEETGITPLDLEPLVELRFLDDEDREPPMLGLAFRARRFHGTPHPTPEAEPFWCSVNSIPYARMWPDDRIWLPRLLAGEALRGEFLMAGDRLLEHRLRVADPEYLRRLATTEASALRSVTAPGGDT